MKEFIFDQIEMAVRPLYQENRQIYWEWFDKRASLTRKLLDRLNPQIPKGKSPQISFNVLDSDLNILDKPRVKTRTTRFLTRKLSLNSGFFSDKTIQDIANAIDKHFFEGIFEIRLDSGKQITKNYRNKVGGGSCMTGNCTEYTTLYEMNPDRFRQLVVKYCGDSARAIVSKLDNGKYYCDRVYATADNVYYKLLDYVDEQSWKSHKDDKPPVKELSISGLKWEDGHVPYLDTFCFYKITEDGKLDIFADDNKNHDGCTDNTDGYLLSTTVCAWCTIRYHRDEVTYIGNYPYCHCCIDIHFYTCNECGVYVSENDIDFVHDNSYCRGCYDSLTAACDDCGERVYKENITETENGEICEDCIGDYFECEVCSCVVGLDDNEHDNICDNCYEDGEE
jgi:hypothetical protein